MDAKQLWCNQPKLAHQQWRQSLLVANRTYSEQSERLYCSLFGRFTEFLVQEKTNIIQVNSIQIAAFLDTLKSRRVASSDIEQEASNRTKRTYLAEIDRVLAYLVNQDLRVDNPAHALIQTLRITHPLSSRNIDLLPLRTQRAYLHYVDQLQNQIENNFKTISSIELQSVAMNLLMLEHGLTLKEIQKLRILNIEDCAKGFFYTPGHRVLEDRTLALTTRSQFWLYAWLEVRKNLKVFHTESYRLLKKQNPMNKVLLEQQLLQNAKPHVFIAFSGKGENRENSVLTDKIPESSIFLCAQQVLLSNFPNEKKLDPSVKRKGPQILRNTYCANLVLLDIPLEEKMRLCGLRTPNQIWAMQRYLKDSAYAQS